MRLASFLVLLTIFVSGCGIKGPLYLPEKKPVETKPQPSGLSVPATTPQQSAK